MILASSLLLAVVQVAMLSPLQPSKQVVAVPNRLDCLILSAQDSFGGRVAGEDKSWSSEVIIFSRAPAPTSTSDDEARGKVEIVRSLDDGRSWIDDGQILEITWKQWPSFGARIQKGEGIVSLASDQIAPGRITYRGSYITTSGGPAYTSVGECRFVPDGTQRRDKSR